MKALAGAGADEAANEDVDVDVLAAKIKALQKEWKKLGPLSPRKDQALWKAFSAAADAAWAPCKEAFEERAGLRRELYRQRMDLVAQLVDYEKKIAWPDLDAPDPGLPPPDWNMVRKTLNAARKAFGEIGPVDRKQERKSRKALDKVCGRIFAHLEKEYARAIERKQALVDEAKALVAADDLKQAIDRAKAIQREWKDAGLTPQRVDRALWKDFRAACDAVFARLGEEREQRNAGARERAVQRQAQERARAEQAAERKRLEQERWQRLLERLQACGLKATDSGQATALWGEDDDLPKGIDAAALQAWWQDGPGEGDADTLREACIALEVLAGIESPPEEKQARMAYQMKRLVEGMGSGPGDARERLLEAINRFVALRPPGDWVGRFCRGLETARNLESKP
jgi:DNA repair protein SbcC/Rad50